MIRNALGLAALLLPLALPTFAADKHAAPTARATKAPARKAPPEPAPAEATPEQFAAAERVDYGRHDCEFGQRVDVVADDKHPGYVDVLHGKATYVMKPVVSS